MQTILGAGGPIADELARALHHAFTHEIRLMSRHPSKVNPTDELVAADLTDAAATSRAVAGSDVVYLTAGLPMDSQLWEEKFPAMMRNTIAAVKEHGAKLVYFDNTYTYAGTPEPQTEETAFAPNGRKGAVRGQLATMLLDEMRAENVEALIGRAPEFYGPGKTRSWTNALVFDRIRAGKRPFVPVSATTRRSLIWTPDASRALALLGNTPDAFGKTWHLPIDQNRLTYRQMVDIASETTGRKIGCTVLPRAVFAAGAHFVPALREANELLPRYRGDNIFDTSRFAQRADSTGCRNTLIVRVCGGTRSRGISGAGGCASTVASGSGDQTEAAVAGASEVPPGCRVSVLGSDSAGIAGRGSGSCHRRGPCGRDALVPPAWWDAPVHAADAVRALPQLHRA